MEGIQDLALCIRCRKRGVWKLGVEGALNSKLAFRRQAFLGWGSASYIQPAFASGAQRSLQVGHYSVSHKGQVLGVPHLVHKIAVSRLAKQDQSKLGKPTLKADRREVLASAGAVWTQGLPRCR